MVPTLRPHRWVLVEVDNATEAPLSYWIGLPTVSLIDTKSPLMWVILSQDWFTILPSELILPRRKPTRFQFRPPWRHHFWRRRQAWRPPAPALQQWGSSRDVAGRPLRSRPL